MKKLLNLFSKKTQKINKGREIDIKHEAQRAFEQYQKTYKDLARYDRGEKIFTN